jgi:hypothetical protein
MRAAALASLIALASCGGEAERETAAPEPAASTPTPAATASEPAPTAAATIPVRFDGVWDAETGTCDPASDLRLDIGPQMIGFYESQGTVTAVDASDPDVASIQLAMEGEGDQWTQTMELSLDGEGGDTFLNVRYLPDPEDKELSGRAGALTLRFKRCPG